MRAKTSFSLFLAMALFFFSMQAYAATPPKSGTACSIMGSSQTFKGKKYTCVKSGKKLQWNKGTAVTRKQDRTNIKPTPTPTPNPTPTPTPTPNPTPTPTPTPKLLEDWEKLRQDVQTRYLERSKSGEYLDFEFILSPTINRAKAQETIDIYRKASRNWTWLFESTETYSIVWVLLTEKDYDWWYAQVTQLQGKNSIYPWDKAKNEFGHCRLSDQAFCGYGNTQEAPDGKMKLFQYNIIGSSFQGEPVANTVHHESVHFYQLANNLTYPGDLPCWYIEGQATFYGNVISRTNDSSFEKSRISASLPKSQNWTISEWANFLIQIQDNRDECFKDSRNYSIGSFLWEYLLLNYTEEELHNAHIALKNQTWAEVALSVLRKSTDQLNTEFAAHLTTIFGRK